MASINTDRPLITLTTDFGTKDGYAGILKGVIKGINRRADIVDINHNVLPFNIESGQYVLETSFNYFPPGTIHLAIIDPGVGSNRKALLIETDQYYFLGPDNGLFSFISKKEIKKIIVLKNEEYFLRDISATFHGRDIFAPVAGYLSHGILPEEFGIRIKEIIRIKMRAFSRSGVMLTGRIIHIDSFGNLVTSFRADDLPGAGFIVYLNDSKIGRLKRYFGSVKSGRPAAYINSSDHLEIAINCGSAAERFSIGNDSKAKILIAPT